MPNTIVFKKNLLSQAIHQSFMQFSMGGRLSTKEITALLKKDSLNKI